MEKLQFILHENVESLGGKSTLGYKFGFGDKWYGNYVVIDKPTVTTQDIMDTLNGFCPEIEQTLKELQANT